MKPGFFTSLNVDPNWPHGNVTFHSEPFFDSFTIKALIILAIVVVLIVVLRNFRKHTRSLSPLANTNRDSRHRDLTILQRSYDLSEVT